MGVGCQGVPLPRQLAFLLSLIVMTNDILSTIILRIVVEGLPRRLKDSCFWEKFMKIFGKKLNWILRPTSRQLMTCMHSSKPRLWK